VMTIGVLGLIAGPIVFALVALVWRDLTGSAPSPPPDEALPDEAPP